MAYNGQRLIDARTRRERFVDHRRRFNAEPAYSGLIREVGQAIANQEAPPIELLIRNLIVGNAMIRAFIAMYEDEHGRLPDPKKGEYDIVVKQCVDTRPMSRTIVDFLESTTLHERTAGAIVRKGMLLTMLKMGGTAFVETHQSCGAEAVAHDYHTGKFNGSKDVDITTIITSIPYAVAAEENPDLRCMLNAIAQVHNAEAIIARLSANGGEMGYGTPIYPLMNVWSPKPDMRWVLQGQPEHPLVAIFRENVKLLQGLAAEGGRTMATQYASHIFAYDPYRLGRFNDPRVMCGVLPNSIFPVTFKFDGILEGAKLSATALGSVKYAGFHDDGHVKGVGGKNGNRSIIIIDPDPDVMHAVKAAMLTDPVIRELTRNGETIILARYDLTTREFNFFS